MKKLFFQVFIALICAAGIMLLHIGFIFFLLGLLPSVVAFMLDETPRRDFFKTIFACNSAGIVPILTKQVQVDYPAAALQIVMSDPMSWLTVYGSAAGGWVLVWICKWTIYLYYMAMDATQAALLEHTQKQLVEEWGEEITKG